MVSSNHTQVNTYSLSQISGIAVTLFIKSVGTIVRKRRSTGQLNLLLVMPSALIFIFATVVSLIGIGIQLRL